MHITFLIGKVILGGYWLMVAPALFLPLGTVLLSWQALRGTFRNLVLLLGVVFAALGVTFLLTLTLADVVTVFAWVLAIWSLVAAITCVVRNRRIRRQRVSKTRARFNTGAVERHPAC
jgi:cytochrome c biogenesis factor